ncbi:uncharacterized protein LOC107272224 [Cephus cinctus]|uniref:Uncharacterized protein LOC107272224 n=1 Tax=Cephus cinctus TaxID=211228 RepID=A0AAJ7RRG3_CEPCN|nr:uncharacterized protein LOC107272224 [Cephus cinctus]
MNVSIEKKMMFTIWTLAKPGSFLAVGDRFGLSKSTGHQIFKNMITILANLLPKYVKWPNDTSRALSEKVFEARSCGISGVIRAIDGCHIPCKHPVGNAIDYYNRKRYHSIILQGS